MSKTCHSGRFQNGELANANPFSDRGGAKSSTQASSSFREIQEEGKALEAIKALLAIGDPDFIKESIAGIIKESYARTKLGIRALIARESRSPLIA